MLRKLRHNPNLTSSGEVIDVDVGIVTGNNKFFVLSQDKADELNLTDSVCGIMTRSGHLEGLFLTNRDLAYLRTNGKYRNLFIPPDEGIKSLLKSVQDYILSGEAQGVHTGYKCRIRKRWYVMPSRWIPEGFFLRQIHDHPRIIVNNANVSCTDTIHRVRFINNHKPEEVASAFINSLTFAFSEVTGRSYGGGVLTFEPSEAENLPLPLNGAHKLDPKQLDKMVRDGNIEGVLDITDKILLIDGLGLSVSNVKKLRSIWKKLRERRIKRK